MPGDATSYAAIDVGTNSVRLLIATVEEGRVRPQLATLRTTRLGKGLARGEGLRPEPVAATIGVLQEYRRLLDRYRVGRWRVVATQAVREAVNAAEFLAGVEKATGLRVEVISGQEEALLNYRGVLNSLPGLTGGVVLDIGGGSTEFTYPEPGESKGQGVCCRSLPVGAVRLTEQPLLLDGILAPIKGVLEEIRQLPERRLVGVGGTLTTLAAVDQALVPYDRERVHGYPLTREAVQRILLQLAAKNTEERRRVPGLQPQRADIIVAGTTILWAILEYLEATELTVSDADLLYGIVLGLS